MSTRRTIAVAAIAVILSSIGASPAAAARPARPEPTPPPALERPLTADEQAASTTKLLAALAYVDRQKARGADTVSLACVTPTSATPGPAGVTANACSIPQGFLPVAARDQVKWYYCGPATGQVVANYAWAVASHANKYTQAKLAEWMQTDINIATNAFALQTGLEKGTAGAPRRPAGWAWVVSEVRDTNGNSTSADELQAMVQANVSDAKMPLAISVKPHHPDSSYHLNSWPDPIASGGHWIAAYGWYSYWTGTDFARIYYTDSSGDEGGSTGKFWNSTKSMNALIAEHTKRIVW
jgi:hypothetical protein